VTKPTLHLIGIFHTIHNQAYSHCAFTGKALRFPKMLQKYGYRVVEYSNGSSESEADEKVQMLSADELADLTDANKRTRENFYGDLAAVGTPWHDEFEKRLVPAMRARVKPGDIICHPFGHAHSRLLSDFSKNIHVETGIGYPTTVRDDWRRGRFEADITHPGRRASRIAARTDVRHSGAEPAQGAFCAETSVVDRTTGHHCHTRVTGWGVVSCGQQRELPH
jgi:hypothetical protein